MEVLTKEFSGLTNGAEKISFEQSLKFSFCIEWLHHQDLSYEALQEAWNHCPTLDENRTLNFMVCQARA